MFLDLLFYLVKACYLKICGFWLYSIRVILAYPFPECPVSDVPVGDVNDVFPAMVEASVK